MGEPPHASSKRLEASDTYSPGLALLRVPRCRSPSCCTPHPTNRTSSSPLGPSRHPSRAGWLCGCPQGHGSGPPAPAAAGLDLASESGSHPTARPVARRPRGANVWTTVSFKDHPAGYLGDECWAKENQECWTRCSYRRGHGRASGLLAAAALPSLRPRGTGTIRPFFWLFPLFACTQRRAR